MTKQIFALALVALLGGNCFGQGARPSLKEQALAIAANSPVEVKFLDGSKQRGWIGEVSDAGFVLTRDTKNRLGKSQVSFTQVEAVKQVKDVNNSHKRRYILIGVAVGVVVGAIVLLLAAGTSYGRST